MTTITTSFWKLPNWEAQKLYLSHEMQEALYQEAVTDSDRGQLACLPDLAHSVVVSLCGDGAGASLANNTNLSAESYEHLARVGDKTTLRALADNSETPLEIQELVYELALQLPERSATAAVLTNLAYRCSSPDLQEKLAVISLPSDDPRDPDFDFAWRIVPRLVENPRLTSRAAAALSWNDGDALLNTLRKALKEYDAPAITLDFSAAFLVGTESRYTSESENAVGRAFLQGVRAMLPADQQDVWDGLLPGWKRSVRDLLDAASFTTR